MSTDISFEIRSRLMRDGKYIKDMAEDIGENYDYVWALVNGRRLGIRGEDAKRIRKKVNDYFGEELLKVVNTRIVTTREPVNA